MKNRTILNILVAMLVIVVLFGFAQSASADVKLTNVFEAWDRNDLQFKHSNVAIFWDGDFVEVVSELDFDTDPYTIVAEDSSDNCSVGDTTPWAGRVELGFYHTDNAPAGADGFVSSQAWKIVDCDFDGDGDVDNADLDVDLGANPPTEYVSADFTVITIDEVVACTTGNCADEIVTTMFVNIDSDCDGTANADLPTEGKVCFFAQGVTPEISDGPPYWEGPLQARFGTSGAGDKTVNFDPFSPTAITLEDFGAQSLGNVHPAVWLTIFLLLAAITFVLIRERSQGAITIRREE